MSNSSEESYEVVNGTVRWFNVKFGYGFISSAESKKIFVHKSDIANKSPKHRGLRRGESVEFEIVETEKGLQAVAVTGPNGAPVQGVINKRGRPRSGQQQQKREIVRAPINQKDHVEEQESLTYPYFERTVPKSLISEDNVDNLYPTEWVGLRINQIKYVFVQVAYPILRFGAAVAAHQCKVFKSSNDYEGEIFAVTEIKKLKPQGGEAHISQSHPNLEKGRKWMEQVDIDCKILEHLYQQCQTCPDLNMYATVCFLAQQVAEKAMTAGIFFSGDKVDTFQKSHKMDDKIKALSTMSHKLDDLDKLERAAQALDDYYVKTRYPNVWPDGVVPANEYDLNKAKTAFENAIEVKTIIQANMN